MKFKFHIHGLLTMLVIIFIGSLTNAGRLSSNVIIDIAYSDITCNGAADGSIEVTVSGGESPYTYVWTYNSNVFIGDSVLDYLEAGEYCLTVSDAIGETNTICQIISEPPPLTISGQLDHISCYGFDDGSVEAQASGGTSPYQYRLYVNYGGYTPWQNNSDFIGLIPGAYSLEVVDTNECVSIYPDFVITEPPPFYIPYQDVNNISCNGNTDGNIEVLIVGGIQPYFIEWNTGATISSLFELAEGQYCISVSDYNGCALDTCYNIIEPDTLSATWTYTDVTCSGANNGTISLDIIGGTTPYNYEWTMNGFSASTEDLINIGPGNYCLLITDSSGCTYSFCQVVTEPDPLTILGQVEHISCYGFNDGSIEAQATGGTSGVMATAGWEYQYRLYTNASGIYTSWQTDSIFLGISPGFYSLEVLDYNNCISVYPDFEIIEPDPVEITNYIQSDITCFGLSDGIISLAVSGGGFPYFVAWDNGSTDDLIQNLDTGEYCVNIINTHGCLYDTCFNIAEPEILAISLSDTDVVCHGVYDAFIYIDLSGGTSPHSFEWTLNNNLYSNDEDLSNIGPGIYCLEVTDYNNCTSSICDTIIEPPSLTISGQVEDISCFNGYCDGSIVANVVGGSPASSFGEQWNYQYRIQNLNMGQYTSWQTDSIFNNLCIGDYSLEVSDYFGCISAYPLFPIDEPDPFVISAIITDESCEGCSDGIIEVSVLGGFPPYYYSWSTGDSLDIISLLLPGDYFITVTDYHNCIDSAMFTVESIPNPGWTVIDSSIIHTVLFDDSATAYLDCSPLVTGDFIGVFYDSLGSLSCGGYFMWDGDSILMDIYGDDPLIADKTGFYENEIFQWLVWQASDSTLHDLDINYITSDPLYPDYNFFVTDGVSKVENVFSIIPQVLDLPAGWSLFSLNTNPLYPNIVDLFFPVVSNVLILKNGNGLMYWPAFSLNLIGNVIIGEGYQISMFNSDTLVIDGTCLWPEQNPIVIMEGWSILGYLRRSPAPVDEMLLPIQSSILIVKSEMGAAYWPYFNLNLIGDMIPGKGYQIKMSVQDTLVYPPNDTIFLNNTIIPTY